VILDAQHDFTAGSNSHGMAKSSGNPYVTVFAQLHLRFLLHASSPYDAPVTSPKDEISISIQPVNFQNSPVKPILAKAASASATVFGRQSGFNRSAYHSLARRHP
jgi:hypothetical protein